MDIRGGHEHSPQRRRYGVGVGSQGSAGRPCLFSPVETVEAKSLTFYLIFPPSCPLSVYIILLAPLQQVNLSQGDPFVENQWAHIPFIVISSICLEMSTFLESETCCCQVLS